MNNPCLYPVLAGSQVNRPLWAEGTDGAGNDLTLLEDLLCALKGKGIRPEDLAEVVIPFVDPQVARRIENDNLWMPIEAISVDALINGQVNEGGASDMLSKFVRRGDRSLAPDALRLMPTLSHCAAVWGILAIQDLLYNDRYAHSASPILRDNDLCWEIMRSFERYASSHYIHHIHGLDGLKGTPHYPEVPRNSDVRSSLIQLCAMRISHRLTTHRPVHFQFIEVAPTPVIAELIRLAQGADQ